MEPKTKKRIVSQGEYVWRQTHILFLSGMLLFCGVWFVLLISTILYKEKIVLLGEWRGCIQPDPIMIFVHGLFSIGLLTIATKCLRAKKRKNTYILRGMQPLTRASTADLPAPESLLRASEEPVQEQVAMLLRATTETREKHEEQLVRASAGGTE